MAIQTITISNILDGFSQTKYLSSEGSFDSSIGIDPDYPLTSTDTKTSGVIVPTQYADFSSTGLSGAAIWLMTNPKDTNLYVYASDGELISYSSALTSGSESVIGTPTSGAGNGGVYYNNFIYLMTPTDVSRYGPLNNSPSLTNTVWTGSTLGSQTALTNTTYPTLRSISIPNHPGHVHGDNALYFGDFINGAGLIHKIITKKTTDEGDTNNGSAYNALDLPFGFMPVDIESWGTDLVILTIQTSDTTINQGKAALFFWDPTDTVSFYRGPMYLPDALGTALLNVNGVLRIFSGNASSGVRISKYLGGDSISDSAGDTEFIEDSLPPLAGAVDAFGGRGVFGGFTTYPENSACVWAIGSKESKTRMGLHNVVRTASASSTNQIATSVRYVEQASNITPRVVVGWRDGSNQGIDKLSTSSTINSVFRTRMINVGERFQIVRIRIPLGKTIASNMEIIPKIYLDDASTTQTLATINSTNYANSNRKVIYREPELANAIGENNFFLEFNHGSTTTLPQLLPIVIDIETFEDELN